jgi:hypothetical protein
VISSILEELDQRQWREDSKRKRINLFMKSEDELKQYMEKK